MQEYLIEVEKLTASSASFCVKIKIIINHKIQRPSASTPTKRAAKSPQTQTHPHTNYTKPSAQSESHRVRANPR